MTHLSEDCAPLTLKLVDVYDQDTLLRATQGFTDVCMLILPPCPDLGQCTHALQDIGELVAQVAKQLAPDTTLITVGEVVDLVHVQAAMPRPARYQHWFVIRRTSLCQDDNCTLSNAHFGALVNTKYEQSLRHTKTRIKYTYCPACNKTTKDYGGKKHTYNRYGTLMSDIWRDIQCDLAGDLSPIITRFQDLFGLEPYEELLVLDCRQMELERPSINYRPQPDWNERFIVGRDAVSAWDAETSSAQANFILHPNYVFPDRDNGDEETTDDFPPELINRVLQGDCLTRLREIPDDSVDFVFTDPPYNLGKKYSGYADDLEIQEYFNWCDLWIAELARILKPGRTLTLLNIPLWSVRHFLFLETVLEFQNWIAWDALAFPVRFIMPAHYTILAFSKGQSRVLPGLVGESGAIDPPGTPKAFRVLEPLADKYCLRARCVRRRQLEGVDDRTPLTDLWWDIHRLKHNSRRVDHPTQLPPHLMYRLIAIFTKPGEIVLDCFNGAGTTTLAAHQLGRRYVGIEKAEKYCNMARSRHQEIQRGLNPFRKAKRKLTAKNSPVPRMPKRKYKVPKKTLQLEVRRVAQKLGHLPDREELSQHGKYPIKYYDEYFVSWGEVCAAARTTGMSELPPDAASDEPSRAVTQLSLDFNESTG